MKILSWKGLLTHSQKPSIKREVGPIRTINFHTESNIKRNKYKQKENNVTKRFLLTDKRLQKSTRKILISYTTSY